MKRLGVSRLILMAFVCVVGIDLSARSLNEAKRTLAEGFKDPSYERGITKTNLDRYNHFSLNDIAAKTYVASKSYHYLCTKAGTYAPANESTGSPMIQVTASSVIIDLNELTFDKFVADSEVRSVAIEVGRSPADANYSLATQPQNVIIRNGTLENFDIGVVIHQGVRGVTFEDLTISNSPVGIVFMGANGTDEEVVSCSMNNVTIIGGGVEDSAALAWAKAKFEGAAPGQFSYGNDSFVGAINPETGTEAAGVYCGIVMRHVNNMKMKDVTVKSLGYQATGSDTVTYGIDVVDSSNLFLENVSSSGNVSPSEAIGCHIKDSTSVSIVNSFFNSNKADRGAAVDTTNARRGIGLFLESVSAAILHNVSCNENEADSSDDANPDRAAAYGILWQTGTAITLRDIDINQNEGNAGFAYGMKLDTTESVEVDGVTADYNHGTGGDLGAGDDDTNTTNMGATGISFSTSVKTLSLRNGSANYNNGSSVIGLRVFEGEEVTIDKFNTNSNNGVNFVKGMAFNSFIKKLAMSHVAMVKNSSSGGTVNAATFASGQFVDISDATCNDNTTTDNNQTVVVLEFATSANVVTLRDVVTRSNVAHGNGVIKAIDFTDGRSIRLEKVECNNNTGGGASSIIHFQSSSSSSSNIRMRDITARDNSVTHGINVINMASSVDVAMNDVKINNNLSIGGTATGINFATSAQSIHLSDVDVNGTEGVVTTGIIVAAADDFRANKVSASHATGTAETQGISFTGSAKLVDLADCSFNNNTGTVVDGLKMVSGESVFLSEVKTDRNNGSGAVTGMNFDTSVKIINFNNVFASNNVSTDDDATGILITQGDSVFIDGASCNYNAAAKVVRGMYFKTSVKSADLSHVSANRNVVNSSGSENGRAYGIVVEEPSIVDMSDISASQNSGEDRGYGLLLNGEAVSAGVSNVRVSDSTFNNNSASNAATALTAADTSSTVSKHLPVNSPDAINWIEGGFGVYVHTVDNCTFEKVEASKNNGMRAGGVYVTTANNCMLKDCKTSFQHADGYFFLDSDIFSGLDKEDIVIDSDQKDTLYGGTSHGAVDLLLLTKDFLHGLRNIKYLQDTDTLDPKLSDHHAHIKELATSQILLRGVMAQFRAFSTAVGVQLHNCENCRIENHFAIGNKSEEDSAVGIGMSGTANGHIVLSSKCAGNEAWTDSKIAPNGDIDITAVRQFWTFLGAQALNADPANAVINGSGKTSPIDGIITPTTLGHHTVGDGIHTNDQPVGVGEPTIDGDRLPIVWAAETAPFEEFGPAVGGESVGILVGDAATNIEVKGCDCSANKGHAGKAFGILQDVSIAMLSQDNKCYHTDVSDLGYAFGMAEFTKQSNSIHIRNVMFNNSVGDMLNSSYLIPFDPDVDSNIFFTVRTGYNGDFTNFANASAYDNLEVKFISEKPASSYIGDDVVAGWIADAWTKEDLD